MADLCCKATIEFTLLARVRFSYPYSSHPPPFTKPIPCFRTFLSPRNLYVPGIKRGQSIVLTHTQFFLRIILLITVCFVWFLSKFVLQLTVYKVELSYIGYRLDNSHYVCAVTKFCKLICFTSCRIMFSWWRERESYTSDIRCGDSCKKESFVIHTFQINSFYA